MTAFVPFEDTLLLSSTSSGTGHHGRDGQDGGDFLNGAEELRALPADLISPLRAYSLYRQHETKEHSLRCAVQTHSNSSLQDHALPSSSHSLLPSTSPWSIFDPSSLSPTAASQPLRMAATHLDSRLSPFPDQHMESSSFAPSSFVDPSNGFTEQLNNFARMSARPPDNIELAQRCFPLTPPLEDPHDEQPASYPFSFDRSFLMYTPGSETVFSPYLSSSSAVTKYHPFTGSQGSSSTNPSVIASAVLRPDDSCSPSSATLSSVIAAGLARRRSRIPALPSPSLSSSSNQPSVGSANRPQSCKGRAAQGGSRSQYFRDEVVCPCVSCHVDVATLQLRKSKKGETDDVDFVADLTCFECVPDPAGTEAAASEFDSSRVGYSTSLSALLDRQEGVEVPMCARRAGMGSRARARRSASGRGGERDDWITCDVCRKNVATGEIRAAEPGEKLNFTVEVICAHCSSTYRRCSDDGGGGGRLGVGKWRCKELFEEGRKNCSFSHARMGPIQDLAYDTHSISSITQELPRLETACFEFFHSSVLSALAVPDVLEGEYPIATSYEQIERMATDSWTHFAPFFEPCSDPKRKRFIGLRWANPTTRKKGKGGKSPALPMYSAEHPRGAALRPGLRLTGFAIMEVDLDHGVLFTPLAMPIGSVGETYDASTKLLQHLSRHVESDLEFINIERSRNCLPKVPPITEAWTAVLFSKDTRGANHLETRRGYLPLEKYASLHGVDTLQHINDRLDEFLPSCLKTGWRLFARPYGGPMDDWGQPTNSRRRRKSASSVDNPRTSRGENSDDDYEEIPASKRPRRSRF